MAVGIDATVGIDDLDRAVVRRCLDWSRPNHCVDQRRMLKSLESSMQW